MHVTVRLSMNIFNNYNILYKYTYMVVENSLQTRHIECVNLKSFV